MRGAAILALLLASAFVPSPSQADWPTSLSVRATGILPVDFETGTRSRGGEAAIVYAAARTASFSLTAGTYTHGDGRLDERLKSIVASVELSPPSRLAPWIGFGLGIGWQTKVFDLSRFDGPSGLERSDTDVGMNLGGGFRLDLSSRLRVRTGIEMRSVDGDQSAHLDTAELICWTASLEAFPGR